MFLKNTPAYRRVNSDAHRTRPTNLRGPALTWHMAFWNPKSCNLKNELDKNILSIMGIFNNNEAGSCLFNPEIRGKRILFDNIYDSHDLSNIDPQLCNEREKDIFDRDYRTIQLTIRQPLVNYTIRIETSIEYFTISVIAEINFSNEASATQTFLKIFKKLKQIIDLEVDIPYDISRPKEISIESKYLKKKINKTIYYSFWRYCIYIVSKASKGSLSLNNTIFNDIFADFRGLIISDETFNFKNEDLEFSHKNPSWGNKCARPLHALVTSLDRYECTASYMLHGRALYMTALGPQVPEHDDRRRDPVTYVVCVQQRQIHDRNRILSNKWQLGRLIDRLHLIGTVRLAALSELHQLRAAGSSLREIDPLISVARKAIEDLAGENSKLNSALMKIDRAQRFFNRISEEFTNGDKKPGIAYRIERSRYYVQQFKDNIKFLRIVRVEGYQKYDHFVERRLGDTFDYIDRLGRRYERAGNSLSQLNQSFFTLQADRTGQNLSNIQRYGELALVGVLVPYYIISTILHVKESPWPTQFAEISISSAFISYAAYRFAEQSSDSNEQKLHWAGRAGCFCINVLGIYLFVTAISFLKAIYMLLFAALTKRLKPKTKTVTIPNAPSISGNSEDILKPFIHHVFLTLTKIS